MCTFLADTEAVDVVNDVGVVGRLHNADLSCQQLDVVGVNFHLLNSNLLVIPRVRGEEHFTSGAVVVQTDRLVTKQIPRKQTLRRF